MPPKSRKNRRNIPQNRTPAAAPQSRQGPAPGAAAAAAAAIPSMKAAFAASPAKPAPATFRPTHILSELKWIGLVTLFIVVVLVLTYSFIPR
jgi:hypothetical protein